MSCYGFFDFYLQLFIIIIIIYNLRDTSILQCKNLKLKKEKKKKKAIHLLFLKQKQTKKKKGKWINIL